jgi:hypothetical protein
VGAITSAAPPHAATCTRPSSSSNSHSHAMHQQPSCRRDASSLLAFFPPLVAILVLLRGVGPWFYIRSFSVAGALSHRLLAHAAVSSAAVATCILKVLWQPSAIPDSAAFIGWLPSGTSLWWSSHPPPPGPPPPPPLPPFRVYR